MPSEPYGYQARPDGHGGITLVPNQPLQRAIDAHYRTRDAGLTLPGARAAGRQLVSGKGLGDEDLDEPDPQGAGAELDPSVADPATYRGQVVATLDPPEEGMAYRLEANPDGSFAVILCPADDEAEIAEAAGDRSGYRHGTSDARLLNAMNRVNRRRHARDRRTLDKEQTLFTHTPLRGERVVLRERPDGSFVLILISPDANLIGRKPLGADADADEVRSSSAPSRSGDRRPTEFDRLAEMNRQAREFWRRK